MRYIISGGGTGGHIYPALAIAKEIKKRDGSSQIYYVGKKNSLEEELVSKAGLDLKFLPINGAGLPRKSLSLKTLKSIALLIVGLIKAALIVKKVRPDIIIATGGYVCAPITMAGQLMGVKSLIQEQNAYPGKTNKLLSKKANAICLNFEEAEKYFPKDKILVTGNPIREEFSHANKDLDKKSLDFQIKKPMVLSFGGSGGQESTNDAILDMLKKHELDFFLLHITGKEHYQKFMELLGSYKNENLKILDYSHQIPELLPLADLVIASSSAMTLAEISATGLASILIPKAYTAGDHQSYNARSYEKAGASVVIEEKDLNGDVLYNKIQSVLKDEKKKNEMGANSKKMASPDGVKKIVDKVFELIGNKNGF